ncbi:MAG: SGNH/GDSL hydrolase family protein [Polyangiaceae bacterium]|nr:SGNH/GDSL hydrolase family protein [Polyangiaceae bacterium]
MSYGRLAFFALALSIGCSDDGDQPTGGGGAGGAPGATTTTGGPVTSGPSTSGPTTTSTTASTTAASTSSAGGGGAGGGHTLTVAECYADDYVNPPSFGPDYDQFGPVVGSHCMGTNHQAISGVERVVFLGDSVTVGTPPTLSADYYRSQLADSLAQTFSLSEPGFLWKLVNVFNGVASQQDDGAFSTCSKWGARTDDFLMGGNQIAQCFPQSELDKRTLVIMTMGGNDISSLTQDAIDGVPMDQLQASTEAFVQNMEDSIAWLKEPGRFPNGVFVIFGNMYEFTDGTGEVQSCDVSALAGFDQPVPAPMDLAALVVYANEQFARIAVDYQVDMIFMLEDFCGHGYERDNPMAPCYRGPGQEAWFDLTCIHPTPAGHDHLTEMFMAVVNE